MISSSSYTSLAEYYDRLNAHVPYEEWADFLERTFHKYGTASENIWLDMACGTGEITLALAKRGHMMIGTDLSPDMLNVARQKADDAKESILWLCQDMRRLELYGTVDCIVCNLDSLNYLPSRSGLLKCFKLVNNYLGPGGILIFDVNTPYKFREIYGDKDYILEAPGVFCGWHNCYDPHHGCCTFDLTIFAEENDGSWHRMEETQKEYCYSMQALTETISEAELELIGVYSDFSYTPASEKDERWFFVCRGTGK